MDVNYYLHREQVERSRAKSAVDEEVRAAHREMADLYRARIEKYRDSAGAPPEEKARMGQVHLFGA